MAQRLVRLNCAKCREQAEWPADALEQLGVTPQEMANAKFAKGKGCPECRGTGFKGRIGVFELVLGTPDFRAAIGRQDSFPDLARVAREQGYRTMMEDGKSKVLAGWTTPEEVLKAVFTQAVD